MIQKSFYHQVENTNGSELSTHVYTDNTWEFNSPHFHKNFELLVVLQGSCRYTVGQDSYDLQPGQAVFVLPFQVHCFFVKEGAAVRCTTFCDLLILTLAKQFDKKKLLHPVFTPTPALSAFFLDSLNTLFGTHSSENRHIPQSKRMKLKGCLYSIGGEILEKTEPVPVESSDMVVMDIVEYISENFKNNISLRDVAEAKGYNYQYLSRSFNRVFGINFKSMLNRYRTNHAITLLRDTKLPLSEIAFESGFQSIRSFDHVFRESLGRSPKAFRQEIV